MAEHKYSNSDEAFAALTGSFDDVQQRLVWASNCAYDAYNSWADPATKPQVYNLLWGILQTGNALNKLITEDITAWQRAWLYECFYWMKQETGKITMSDILVAMSEAEPHQPLLFMAYVQAYEASVWNASFDERFFADLVKKWSIWE